MKKYLLSLVVLIGIALNADAQQYVLLKQGTASDTISKSQTKYTSAVNLNTQVLQSVIVAVKTTSVSGTPDTKYVLQRSVDNVNWWSLAGDTISYSATATQYVTVNPFYGAFARVKIYTGSGTQLSKMTISLKSNNVQ